MGAKIPVIDDIAWLLFRLIGAIQAMLFQIFGMLNKSKKLGDKVDLIGRIYAGWYIFGAKDPNSVPKIVRDRGIMVGRFMLAIIVFEIIINIAKVITK